MFSAKLIVRWVHICAHTPITVKGVTVNVSNNVMTGVYTNFYDMNKIMKNLLGEDEIDKLEAPTVHAHGNGLGALDGCVGATIVVKDCLTHRVVNHLGSLAPMR